MPTSIRLGLAALAAAFVLAPGLARAERAAVLVAGAVKRADLPALRAAVAQAATDAGWQPVVPLLSSDDEACLAGERRATCAAALMARTGADRGIVVVITTDGSRTPPDWLLSGWVLDPQAGVLALRQRYCEPDRCSAAIIAKTAYTTTQELVVAAGEVAGGRTVIVRSTPPGATVSIDGVAVGATEASVAVGPGPHRIEVAHPGYRAQALVVAVDHGTRTVGFALAPTPRRRRLPWIVLGAGVAAAATGGVLYALDQDQAEAGGQRLPRYRDTETAALVTGLAGAAAVTTGLVLLLVGDRERPPPPVQLSAAPGGLAIGLAGAF